MILYKLFLLEYVLLAGHQGKTAKKEDKVNWNRVSMSWRHIKIGLIAFIQVHILCRRFYKFFRQEGILITAQQNTTA